MIQNSRQRKSNRNTHQIPPFERYKHYNRGNPEKRLIRTSFDPITIRFDNGFIDSEKYSKNKPIEQYA
ncbi:hypothetical protein DC3_32250 [Deinococcus cellulosilyticus NBRC 106333 = KACC 11606]|uniref:Uncharacterized protein n=1 Tax=Deinococcus cellulosilyticus (strain DSM 18568 / NBRC 106333 / KACC 11606 / 5516J-15) TaxID=1223518 RepID=A0A511N3Z9_DEIC1|nr:hypothetical protein DC3_32250 [Deinococcus cellulosilyticus NBRC 106333 = KACC 11606]